MPVQRPRGDLSPAALPSEAEVKSTRRLVMVEAHLLALIPLLAVFLARGVGTK